MRKREGMLDIPLIIIVNIESGVVVDRGWFTFGALVQVVVTVYELFQLTLNVQYLLRGEVIFDYWHTGGLRSQFSYFPLYKQTKISQEYRRA